MHFLIYNICLINFLYVSVISDGSQFPEAHPPYDVSQHENWKLIDRENCGRSMADRIIGGKNASLGAYPWIALLGYWNAKSNQTEYRCGGVLINRSYILTAAHCVTNLPTDRKLQKIRLGEHNLETDIDCDEIRQICAEPVQDLWPGQVIVHKDYGDPKFRNDLALIRLDRQVTLNGWIQPVCLPHGELLTKSYLNQKAEVAGWGIYDIYNPNISTILRTLKVPIVPLSLCVQKFKRFATINARQMCVGGIRGEDSCAGDSGGPLMKVEVVGDDSPKYYLIGIVSFGVKRCGVIAFPAVYTRISAYLNWILDNISL